MYSKAEVSQLKQEFWTVFGKYLSPHLSSEGEKVNWINYKTGFKSVQFKMDANQFKAIIYIEISHPDIEVQKAYFEKFQALKAIFQLALQETWTWESLAENAFGKLSGRIFKEQQGVNILDRNSWPSIISFLKPRIISLDGFWNDVKPLFEELR